MWGFIMKQIKMLRQTNAYVGIATVRYGGIHAMKKTTLFSVIYVFKSNIEPTLNKINSHFLI